ncbi:MAG: putative transcriptional regulator [Bacteroidetes bacterium]|nr:MAG: putative transcriptional regulator [Bacteroidota bacterium]
MEKLIHIKSNDLKPRRGRVLIAEPLMDEFYFGRSVILLADHNDEGTFGLVMNKPTGTTLNEILPDFPDFPAPVFIGGPVQTDNLYFIHTLGNEVPDSSEILPGIYWGGDLEIVKELLKLGLIGKDQIRFFLGYAGWSPSQLDEELKNNAWVVSETNLRSLFKTKSDKMWNNYLQRMGPAYDLWRRFPVNPDLN